MQPFDIFLAMLAALFWGCNFVAAKISLAHYPPLLLMALRFCIVSIVLLPFVPVPAKKDLKRIFQLSIVLGTMHFALMFGSLYMGLNVMTCILVGQIGTPFACLLGWMFFGDRLGALRIGALFLGFLGVAIIAATPASLDHVAGLMMALVGGCMWAISNIVMKSIEQKNIYTVLGWMGLFSLPQLLILSLIFEHDQIHILMTPTLSASLGLAYTIVCSTLMAYGLWYYILRKYTVSLTAPYGLLMPVFGILASNLYLGEPLTLRLIIGGALTLIALGIISLPRSTITPRSD